MAAASHDRLCRMPCRACPQRSSLNVALFLHGAQPCLGAALTSPREASPGDLMPHPEADHSADTAGPKAPQAAVGSTGVRTPCLIMCASVYIQGPHAESGPRAAAAAAADGAVGVLGS